MVNIADKIFNFLRKRFVKTNGRFPTPKEADDILDDAQKAVSDAVQQNLEQYAGEASPQEIISQTLSQDAETIYLNAERYRAEGGAPMSNEMREAMPKAQIEAMPLKDPTLRERAMKKKLEALNEQSKVNLEKSGAKARAKVQKDKEGLESLGDQIPVRDDTPQIGEVIDQTKRSRMPMRLIENFGEELDVEKLIKEGYTPTQAKILVAARNKMLSGEEMNPNEALLRVKEERADELGIDVEDVDPEGFDFEIDYSERDDFEQGGIASTKDFIESTGESELMDIYIKVMDGTLPEDALTKALERRGYKTYAKGGVVGGKKEEEEELEDDDPGMFDDLFDRMFGEYELEKLRKSGRKPNAEGGIMDTREGYQFGGAALKYIREAMRKARKRSGVSGTGEPMFQRFSSELKEKVGDDIVDTPRGQYSIADADKLRKRGTIQLLLDELKLIENIEKQQGITGIPGKKLEDFSKNFFSSDPEVSKNAMFDFVKTMTEYGVGTPGKTIDDFIAAEKGVTIDGIEEARGALELYRRNLEGRKLNAEGGLNYLMGF